MDRATADRLTTKYPLGKPVTEGKTKIVRRVKNEPDLAVLILKDDITAGDGARRDIVPGKGYLANETTCNVFRLLKSRGLPIAFMEQNSVTSFVALMCDMLPYEVIIRCEAHGSYCERYPDVSEGTVFKDLKTEVFLKTNGLRWRQHQLPADDPLLRFSDDGVTAVLHHPHEPFDENIPFLTLPVSEIFTHQNELELLLKAMPIAGEAFKILKRAWDGVGGRLVDFKVEFGLGPDGRLLLADAIDPDSWRVFVGGEHVDKEPYRRGESVADMMIRYKLAAKLTGQFGV